MLGTRLRCAKMAEPIEMPFGDCLTWIQGTMYSIGFKIRRILSPPRGVTRRRCGLLPNYFGRLFYLGPSPSSIFHSFLPFPLPLLLPFPCHFRATKRPSSNPCTAYEERGKLSSGVRRKTPAENIFCLKFSA